MALSPPTGRSRRPRAAMDERMRARRRQVAHDRARRRRRVTLSVSALLLLAAGAAAVARSPLFDLVDVRVVGASGDAAVEVREAAALRPGDNLLAVDLGSAAARVAELAWVREAEARRIPPSTVEVRAVPREPVAVVRLDGRAWLVDAEAVLVAGGARDDLVEVAAPNSVLPGVGVRISDAALRNAIAVRNGLPEPLRAAVVRYEAPSERGLRLHLDSGVVVRFGSADRVGAKARSVAMLLEQARTQSERHGEAGEAGGEMQVAEVDVRAPDNPVLVPAVRSDGSGS